MTRSVPITTLSSLVLLLLSASLQSGCDNRFGLAGDETALTGMTRNLQDVPLKPAWRLALRSSGLKRELGYERGAAGHDLEHNRVAIGGADGVLFCLRASSGEVLWRVEIGGGASGPALFDGGRIIVGTDDGQVIAFDAVTGDRIWTYRVQGAITAGLKIVGDKIYFSDGSNAVFAIDRETGAWRWQYRRESPAEFALSGEASPTIAKGRLHIGFSDGVLVTLDAKDGAVLWTQDMSPDTEKFQDIDASAVVIDGTLYAASASSGLMAMNPATKAVRWTKPIKGIIHMSAVDGDLLLSLDRGELIRIDGATGARIWRTRFQGRGAPGQAVRVGDLVAVGLSRGGLYLVDVATGQPRQHFSPGSGIYAAPSAGRDGSLYVLSNGGVLYALRPGR